MKRINEIFHSIQGEGCHSGVPSVFVRFSGCNLKCSFCDTEHAPYTLMNDDEIIDAIRSNATSRLILTGGEPALQIDSSFISKLKLATGLPIAIETNGTIDLPEGIDWITVSPKTGMSEQGNASLKVKRADELKVVDVGQSLDAYFDLECVKEETVMLLQPCHVEDPEENARNLERTIERVLRDPRWRLSLQTHRLIGVK